MVDSATYPVDGAKISSPVGYSGIQIESNLRYMSSTPGVLGRLCSRRQYDGTGNRLSKFQLPHGRSCTEGLSDNNLREGSLFHDIRSLLSANIDHLIKLESGAFINIILKLFFNPTLVSFRGKSYSRANLSVSRVSSYLQTGSSPSACIDGLGCQR